MTYRPSKINKHCIHSLIIALLVLPLVVMGGCSKRAIPTPEPTLITPVTPISLTITVTPDPSLEEIKNKDPYAQVSKYVIKTYKPDKDLYNTLFNAIDKMETTVDISKFPLSVFQKVATMDSLYEQAGLQFYYVDRIKISKDNNSALITYTDTKEEGKRNKEIFYSKLSHLVYNVAPETYSPLQKLFGVYDYITTNSDYTDNMQDSSTHSPYSILMKGKGICGGFSYLGYYVLNRVGIKTEYISNEPHAWNMVNIDGENYLTDITWGAGSYGSTSNSINNILMDDEQRKLTLENGGFGGYKIIEGYPGENTVEPLPATDKRFKAYYDLYYEYALDIENNWVYYSNEEGIKRMALDTKGLETVSPMQGAYLKTFNGILYFISTESGKLYKLEPGKSAQLVDDSVKVESINLKDGILYYKAAEGEAKEKNINLNPFVKANFNIASSKHQESITVPRQQTFKVDIEFSSNMDTKSLPKEAIALVNKKGEALPIHMDWSEDGRILTVRSKVALDNEDLVSLYVSQGITDADGKKTVEAYDITINIAASKKMI